MLAYSLGLILLTASIAKLFSRDESSNALVLYGISPKRYAGLAWAIQIAVESVIGIALVFRIQERLALLSAGFLFLVFSAVMARVLGRGSGGQCGCLGKVLRLTIDRSAVWTNAFLGLLAFLLFGRLDASSPITPGENALVWMGATTLMALYWLSTYSRSVSRLVDEHIERASRA